MLFISADGREEGGGGGRIMCKGGSLGKWLILPGFLTIYFL